MSLSLLAGCGTLSDSGDDTTTLEVWLMAGSLSADFRERFVRDYESRNPDVRVNITVHEWPGINEKVRTALDSQNPPDVIEVGNSQVAEYVEAGGVRNLTTRVYDLGGDDWVPSLAKSGQVDGYQYGVPFYAANRVVIYREDLFRAAGVTSPPRTRDEWLTVTELLDEGEQQGIYLPGQNWYVLAGFVWDEGGQLAVERSGTWAGALDSPEALRGMAFYERMHALGDAKPGSDESSPDELQVFADGGVAQLIAVPGAARLITEHNPELAGKLGFFPIPGKTAEKPGAVFTGGSVLIAPERNPEAETEAGYAFVKRLTGRKWQREMADTMSFVPNRTNLSDALKGEPGGAAMAKAAKNGHPTPASPRWGDLEANNPIKDYQTAVLRGADPKAAARKASEQISELLSGGA
ncbi:sugar transporter [Streptomyces oceani]|uniref:Sugar transporter n=1 Tax=Streptomyces oceani TaxID=1075402 RepID=A0A1E7KJ78_9ACTN|nr:sugar transporter [Streptomyces oceani]